MNKYITLFFIGFIFFFHSACKQESQSFEIYLSPTGNDNNDGSKEKPFATLERARKAIREYKASTSDSLINDVTVYLKEGVYNFEQTFRLKKEDAGSGNSKIVYKAIEEGKVVFSGGTKIETNSVKSINGSPIENIFKEELRDSIFFIDLKEQGITDYGKMVQHGFSIAIKPSPMELFINDKSMHLARWPNDSMIPVLEVISGGSVPRSGDTGKEGGIFKYGSKKPSTWKNNSNLWIYGYFNSPIADDNLKVKEIDTVNNIISLLHPHMYGIASSLEENHWAAHLRRFYFYNIPEELDKPGEYYLDRNAGRIYFYPPTTERIEKVQASILEEPMISLIDVSHITLDGIIFECSRGMGIYMEGGERVNIKNCTFRNLGTVAIMNGQGVDGEPVPIHDFTGTPVSETIGNVKAHMYDNTTWNRNGGKKHTIENCLIYQTGTGGILLSGGDRLTLEPGSNVVKNCEIHNYNRINGSYCPAIHVDGVGNKVVDCYIHDAPHQGVAVFGNEHLIKGTLFENVCMEASDMGAVYMGRNPTERGNTVTECIFNQVGTTHEQSVTAIYLDDLISGMKITRNVFRKAGKGYFSAVYVNNGSDVPISYNLFIDTKSAYNLESHFTTEDVEGWKNRIAEGGIYNIRLKAVNYKSDPWKTMYPNLANFENDNPAFPSRVPFHDNLVIRSKVFESRTGVDKEKLVYENLVYKDFQLPDDHVEFTVDSDIGRWLDISDVDKVLEKAGLKLEDLLEAQNENLEIR